MAQEYTLSQALKLKNRLAGELARQQSILQRENSRRSDNPSNVDRKMVDENITQLRDRLIMVKTAIATANIGIYEFIARLDEVKSQISYLNGLPCKAGPEVQYISREGQPVTYNWESYMDRESIDSRTEQLQITANNLQDKIDAYNATTRISLDF